MEGNATSLSPMQLYSCSFCDQEVHSGHTITGGGYMYLARHKLETEGVYSCLERLNDMHVAVAFLGAQYVTFLVDRPLHVGTIA